MPTRLAGSPLLSVHPFPKDEKLCSYLELRYCQLLNGRRGYKHTSCDVLTMKETLQFLLKV